MPCGGHEHLRMGNCLSCGQCRCCRHPSSCQRSWEHTSFMPGHSSIQTPVTMNGNNNHATALARSRRVIIEPPREPPRPIGEYTTTKQQKRPPQELPAVGRGDGPTQKRPRLRSVNVYFPSLAAAVAERESSLQEPPSRSGRENGAASPHVLPGTPTQAPATAPDDRFRKRKPQDRIIDVYKALGIETMPSMNKNGFQEQHIAVGEGRPFRKARQIYHTVLDELDKALCPNNPDLLRHLMLQTITTTKRKREYLQDNTLRLALVGSSHTVAKVAQSLLAESFPQKQLGEMLANCHPRIPTKPRRRSMGDHKYKGLRQCYSILQEGKDVPQREEDTSYRVSAEGIAIAMQYLQTRLELNKSSQYFENNIPVYKRGDVPIEHLFVDYKNDCDDRQVQQKIGQGTFAEVLHVMTNNKHGGKGHDNNNNNNDTGEAQAGSSGGEESSGGAR